MAAGITVAQRTFGQVVVSLAWKRGLIRGEGTATAGSATTLTDATNFQMAVANSAQVKGKFLYIWGGTSAGTIREITSYGTIGVFTWTGNATTPDTTSTWILLDRNPQYLIKAVLEAQRILGFDTLVPYPSTSLVSNNLLDFCGDFEEWTAGAAVAPDGASTSGAGVAVARGTGARRHGMYNAELTPGAGAVGVLTIDLTAGLFVNHRNLARAQEQTLTLKGYVYEAGAVGSAVVRVQTKERGQTAVNTDWTATNSAEWEALEDISTATVTAPDNLVALSVSCRVAANESTGYFDDLRLYGPTLYTQMLPTSLVAMHPVIRMETASENGDYSEPLYYKEDWILVPQSSTTQREIQWLTALPSDRHLFIKGLKIADVVSATATNLNIDADLVATVAAGLLDDATPTEKAEARIAQGKKARIARSGPWVWLDHSLATT